MSGAGHHRPLGYHRVLLDDATRMDAFERAIRAAVRPGDVVLDLGAGTGILAMLAARAGAARVHAVESTAMARVARQLVAWNGLADRVTVHAADARALAPVEPVDLVVSDFLGRFVVDDGMLEAVAAAARWMKPGARFLPARVRLVVAPVGDCFVDAIDSLRPGFYGIDLAPSLVYAENQGYHAALDPAFLLAAPATFATLDPPRTGGAFDAALTFPLARGGELRGFAGWFEATLAPGIVLSTAPGIDSHWGQYLMPVPSVRAEAGDLLRVHLRLCAPPDPAAERDPEWRWSGALERAGAVVAAFDRESLERPGERPFPPAPPASPTSAALAEAANARGAAAFERGDLPAAARAFEEAARALPAADRALAGDVYENLGIVYHQLGRDSAAARAFLRALDGDPLSREQSLRLLCVACGRANRRHDARRYLRLYIDRFGPHPSGLTPDRV